MNDRKKLFEEISSLSTEQRNVNSMNIDNESISGILKIINNEDKTVPYAVEKELPYIEKAVEIIVTALKKRRKITLFRSRYERTAWCC